MKFLHMVQHERTLKTLFLYQWQSQKDKYCIRVHLREVFRVIEITETESSRW